MALREEFERTGNWLFRWRSYLPLAVLAAMMAAMLHPVYLVERQGRPDWWGYLCLAVAAAGLAVRVATVGHVPKGTSGRNTQEGQVAAVLNTTGMYSVLRHPLYLGNFLMWMGVSMFPRIWWLSALGALAFWLYYERIMFAEEEFLRRKFGEAYLRWADSTPAFFPRLRGWKQPELPFSVRSVLRREYPGLLAMVACFWGLDAFEHLAVDRRGYLDPFWTVAFAAALAVFLVLRLLKHKTALLTVEGR